MGRDQVDLRIWGAPVELKHLSTPRKRNQKWGRETPHQSDQVATPWLFWGEARSSGERTGLAPKPASPSQGGGVGVERAVSVSSQEGAHVRSAGYAKGLGRPTGAGESPVADSGR